MEFLACNFDSTNIDPDKDRMGCRKRGMVDAEKPDGFWYPGRAKEEGLPKFCIIRCPEIASLSELPGGDAGMRKIWRDNFDYEVVASRPAQGEFDVRVFELNPGAINQNAIAGVKATRVQTYLQNWGCSNFSLTATDASFTFSLWDAVRSPNFWGVTAVVLAGYSFQLNSYDPGTGVGNITVTVPVETEPEVINRQILHVTRRIEEKGGTVTLVNYPAITFTLEKDDILIKFRSDVKRRVERVYMYQQHRFSAAIMDAAVAAGGYLTLTKAELLAAVVDSMNG